MQGKRMILYISILFLFGCHTKKVTPTIKQDETTIKETLATEQFITTHLIKDDGRLRTNLTDRHQEYLSESLGLWMEYLLLKNDYHTFNDQVEQLQKHFLTNDYLVIWKIKGDQLAPANAFIDDLRIVRALATASKQWNNDTYEELARQMTKALVNYQVYEQLMVDFIEVKSKAQGKDVTLSYLIPAGFETMKKFGILPKDVYNRSKKLLNEAPFSTMDLFPKSYHVPTDTYIYDDEVNMIDQFYTGYHRAQWGGDVTALQAFTKEAFERGDNKLFGRYDHETKEPIVAYESVSVYALAILMFVEIGDIDFAHELYKQMKSLQINDEHSIYNGGYIDLHSKDTHIFDNLLALIAERTILDLN